MRWLFTVPLRIRALFMRNAVEQDLNDEFRDHLHRQIEENLARGLDAGEARFAALRSLDRLTQRKEECRDMRRLNILDDLARDILYAIRVLRGAPAFAITVVLTLGIGLGLNTALFTLFNAYVLHPFAVQDPYSLYHFGWQTTRAARAGLTWRQYQDLRAEAAVFSDIVGFSPVLTRVESRNVQGMAV